MLRQQMSNLHPGLKRLSGIRQPAREDSRHVILPARYVEADLAAADHLARVPEVQAEVPDRVSNIRKDYFFCKFAVLL